MEEKDMGIFDKVKKISKKEDTTENKSESHKAMLREWQCWKLTSTKKTLETVSLNWTGTMLS